MADKNKKKLESVYLAVGDDELKKEMLKKRIIARVSGEDGSSINIEEFDGESLDVSRVISACLTIPFAAEKRLIIVNDVDKALKADLDKLAEYVEDPSDMSVLFLLSTKLAKNTKLYKNIETKLPQCIINCELPKRKDLLKFVIDSAKAKGLNIRDDVAQYLIDIKGENTLVLNSELDKLFASHTTDDPITKQEIDSLIPATARVKPWILVDAFAARNAKRTFELLDKVSDTTTLGLLAMLTGKVRELLCAKHCLKSAIGDISSQIARELGVSEAQKWRFKNHARWAQLYSEKELCDCLFRSIETEKKIKSGADERAALIDWLCLSLGKQGKPAN